MELIDRESLVKWLKDAGWYLHTLEGTKSERKMLGKIIDHVEAMPTVDAEPVKRGKWLSFTDDGEQYEACSECEYTKLIGGANSWCPACGAKMEVDGE